MKINEKNLIKYATTPPIDLEGWLNKRSSNNIWRRRYCVLKNNLFFYFDKKGENDPLGLLILENCTIELADEFDGLSFQIVFDNRNLYTFSAENQEILETWMKSLAGASYEYKKAMVLELQRQLNDINSQMNAVGSSSSPVGSFNSQAIVASQPAIHPNQTDSPKPPPRRQNPFNRPAPAVPDLTSTKRNEPNIERKMSVDKQFHEPSNSVKNNNTNALVYNWETFGDESSLKSSANQTAVDRNKQLNHTVDKSYQSSAIVNDNTENVFKIVHDRFKKIILDDINQYRSKKENYIKPLIIF